MAAMGNQNRREKVVQSPFHMFEKNQKLCRKWSRNTVSADTVLENISVVRHYQSKITVFVGTVLKKTQCRLALQDHNLFFPFLSMQF